MNIQTHEEVVVVVATLQEIRPERSWLDNNVVGSLMRTSPTYPSASPPFDRLCTQVIDCENYRHHVIVSISTQLRNH